MDENTPIALAALDIIDTMPFLYPVIWSAISSDWRRELDLHMDNRSLALRKLVQFGFQTADPDYIRVAGRSRPRRDNI